MAFVLNLQDLSRSGASADGDAVLSISTNSYFNCQSSASQFLCITTITA
ncbi:hypothetical protein ACIBHY_39490 [Nonomuraea sp. NPDC050547]